MANTIDSKKITISIKTGTTRTLIASWSSAKEIKHTKSFSVIWEGYYSGAWMTGNTSSTTETPKTDWKDLIKASEWDVPNEITKVRVKVKPIADTYKSDNSDKNYYEGDWSGWSSVFSGWAKTTKPPTFKIEPRKNKNTLRDDLKIVKTDVFPGKLNGLFNLTKSRMNKFITYLDSFELKWEGWDGANWSDITPFCSYINYNNGDNHKYQDTSKTGYVTTGTEVVVTDTVKNLVRNQTANSNAISLFSFITPQETYRVYRFTVVPKTSNEYSFEPVTSFVTKNYTAKEFKFKKADIEIKYDTEEDQFEASWRSSDFDKFDATVNHVSGFEVEWTYLKPTVVIWETATGDTRYPDNSDRYIDPVASSETIDSENYVVETVKTAVEVPITTYKTEKIGLKVKKYSVTETQTKTVKTNYHVWKSVFQLPDGVRRDTSIRFRIKIKGDGNQDFREAWSAWKYFTNTIDEASVQMLTINRPTISSRKLDAIWSLINPVYTTGFNYQWYYMLKTDTIWRDAQSGTVEINQTTDGRKEVVTIKTEQDKAVERMFDYDYIYEPVDVYKPQEDFTDEELDILLVQRLSGLNTWVSSYDVPEDAAAVMFTVTPVPVTSGTYIGVPTVIKYDISVPILTVNVRNAIISVLHAESRELCVTWPNITMYKGVDYSDYISGYECRWEYKENNIWFDSSGSASYSKMNMGTTTTVANAYSTFTVPEGLGQDTDHHTVTVVRFTVRPTATNEAIFKGAWSNYIEYYINPRTVLVGSRDDTLTFSIVSNEDRTIRATCSDLDNIPSNAWPANTNIEDKHIIFEWSYWQDGSWRLDGEGNSARLDYPYDTFEIPDEIDRIRVRVKPDVDNLSYIGVWSDYQEYDLQVVPYVIDDVDLDYISGSRNSVLANWNPKDIPEGKTVEKWIENFTCEWREYYSGRWWPPETEDIASSDILSDLVSTHTSSREDVIEVRFRIKANPKHSIDFKETWSGFFPISLPLDNIPDIPEVPTASLSNNGYTIFVSTTNNDSRTNTIEIQAYNTTDNVIVDTASISMSDNISDTATWQFTGTGGKQYQFRARALNADGEYKTPELGDYSTNEEGWSEWSSTIGTRPSPVRITSVKGLTSDSIRVDWSGGIVFGSQNESAEYIVERTKKAHYFDASSSNVESTTETALGQSTQYAIYTGLEASTWYFRIAVKKNNSNIQSEWSNIGSCTIGKPPTAPTTWSNKTVGMIGDTIILYWTHNSEDNSEETAAKIEYTVNGTAHVVDLPRSQDDTSQRSYTIPSTYTNTEATIQWRVKTKGGYGADYTGSDADFGYSPWSTQRIIKLYMAPTVSATLLGSTSYMWDDYIESHQNQNGVYDYTIPGTSILSGNTLKNFPLFVRLASTPISQTPIAYAITITANNSYTTTDSTGRSIGVSAGMTVFRRYYNTSEQKFTAMIMPGDVALENGMSYTLHVTLAMNSGLTAETSVKFATSFAVEDYNLDASIGFDKDKVIAYIKPFCLDQNNAYISTVNMAIYRRDFDGGFTLVADGIPGNLMPVITDPHPSLDYARYRLVATDKANGHVQYQDLPPHPIHETSIILQWEESWSAYYELSELPFTERPWNGSMIKLPYNIDTTDSNTVDVEMVEYIGRAHPVSYYGTQVGQKATWNALIPKTDKQTIYDLRRLARYMGNVYVREPSGTGYWAHVEVSFNLTHLETTVPVSLTITRVEGGM